MHSLKIMLRAVSLDGQMSCCHFTFLLLSYIIVYFIWQIKYVTIYIM